MTALSDLRALAEQRVAERDALAAEVQRLREALNLTIAALEIWEGRDLPSSHALEAARAALADQEPSE